ncbi:hypothetical protein LP419_34460 [Massilia sp. H-1]|nr:hypothetical protein LP419_34460 [Massilia sp. H-1]
MAFMSPSCSGAGSGRTDIAHPFAIEEADAQPAVRIDVFEGGLAACVDAHPVSDSWHQVDDGIVVCRAVAAAGNVLDAVSAVGVPRISGGEGSRSRLLLAGGAAPPYPGTAAMHSAAPNAAPAIWYRVPIHKIFIIGLYRSLMRLA